MSIEAVSDGQFTIGPMDPLPEGLDLTSPAGNVVKRYGPSLFGIPGIVSISWKGGENARDVSLNFRTETSRLTGDAILEPSIEGVHLLRKIYGAPKDGPAPAPPATPEHDPAPVTSDVVRGVASIKGVWDYKYADTAPWADGHVTFSTINQSTTELLNPNVRNQFAFGNKPDGTPRTMFVHWRDGVTPPR